MELAIAFLLGVACTIVPAALWAASQRRPAAAPAAPAQPPAPVIVLQPPQPITNNYTYNEIYNDNRRIVMDEQPQRPPAVEMPAIVDRQREIKGRQFKVVGEW